jgi:hypothetical protein
MYKTECIVIYGARCFAETDGYGEKFVFTRAAQPPLPAATTSVLGHAVAASAGWPPRAARFPVLPSGSASSSTQPHLGPIYRCWKLPFWKQETTRSFQKILTCDTPLKFPDFEPHVGCFQAGNFTMFPVEVSR